MIHVSVNKTDHTIYWMVTYIPAGERYPPFEQPGSGVLPYPHFKQLEPGLGFSTIKYVSP